MFKKGAVFRGPSEVSIARDTSRTEGSVGSFIRFTRVSAGAPSRAKRVPAAPSIGSSVLKAPVAVRNWLVHSGFFSPAGWNPTAVPGWYEPLSAFWDSHSRCAESLSRPRISGSLSQVVQSFPLVENLSIPARKRSTNEAAICLASLWLALAFWVR